MKKTALLNAQASNVIAKMGHFDTMVISDAGLPIPYCTERVDLAVTPGVPSFMDVFKTVMTELQVQKIYIAKETKENNENLHNQILAYFEGQNVEVEYITHSELKERAKTCKAVIRSGECTPYANLILEAGCTY